MKVIVKIGSLAVNILLVLSFLFILSVYLFQIEEPLIQFKTVLTGSMSEAYPAGSLLMIKKIAPSKVKVNDVITYRVHSEVVSHRVINKYSVDKRLYFETKGDNNNEVDGTAVLASNVIGKVVGSIAYLGQFFLILKTALGKLALVLTLCQLLLLEYFLKLLLTTA